jgi:hypothetical protein
MRHEAGLPILPNDLSFFAGFMSYHFNGSYPMENLDANDLKSTFSDSQKGTYTYSNIGYLIMNQEIKNKLNKNINYFVKTIGAAEIGLKCTTDTKPSNTATPLAGDWPLFIKQGDHVDSWNLTADEVINGGYYSCIEDIQRLVEYIKNHMGVESAISNHLLKKIIIEDREFLYTSGLTSGYSSVILCNLDMSRCEIKLRNMWLWDNPTPQIEIFYPKAKVSQK